MTGDPKISFVAASRNDDHGGNLLHRMQIFIEALDGQCNRHGLDAELVLVEWNPPRDRPGLAEALRWPGSENCRVRILTVPPKLHRRFDNANTLPLHQMIAKNVGIRRARGDFVVATNIDVLFSDPLMEFLGSENLRENAWYRTDRHDVRADVPTGVSVERQLLFCRDNLLRVHKRDGSIDIESGGFERIYRRPMLIRAFLLLSPLSFLPGLGPMLKTARRSLRLYNACGFLHTNGGGDFTMMSRSNWRKLRGYWEFPGFPIHVDGLLCHAAKFSKMKEIVLSDESPVYHIEHGSGSGYGGYVSGEKWASLEKSGVPRITPELYLNIVFEMSTGALPYVRNKEDWGLADEHLREVTP